jgi:hypothetical protein
MGMTPTDMEFGGELSLPYALFGALLDKEQSATDFTGDRIV